MGLFFVEIGSPYSIALAKKLEELGLKTTIVSCLDSVSSRQDFLKNPAIKIIRSDYLHKHEILNEVHKNYFVPFKARMLDFFMDIEHDFMVLTDRANHKSVSFRKRKLLFYDLIRFWVGFLEQEKPEAVYFPCTPHVGWELVLMQACRYTNTPYYYLCHTAINNRSLFRNSYTEIKKVPENYLPDLNSEQIKNDIDPLLLKDFEDESVVTNVVKIENDAFHGQMGVNSSASKYKKFLNRKSIDFIGHIKSFIRTFSPLGFRPSYFLSMAMDKYSTPILWELAYNSHKKHAKRLKSKYISLQSNTLPLDVPYVYFPMHLQPELTSQPEAGIYEDHLVALENLLSVLPKGWKIYIKENPRQFDPKLNPVSALHYRDEYDLERLLINERIHLVPQSIASSELIGKAKITATLTGTAGWESLLTGKSCITFGKPWYSGCRSCYIVSNQEDIDLAYKNSQLHSPEDVKKNILKFLHYYQKDLCIATLHAPSDVSYNTLSEEVLLENHAKFLYGLFRKNI